MNWEFQLVTGLSFLLTPKILWLPCASVGPDKSTRPDTAPRLGVHRNYVQGGKLLSHMHTMLYSHYCSYNCYAFLSIDHNLSIINSCPSLLLVTKLSLLSTLPHSHPIIITRPHDNFCNFSFIFTSANHTCLHVYKSSLGADFQLKLAQIIDVLCLHESSSILHEIKLLSAVPFLPATSNFYLLC